MIRVIDHRIKNIQKFPTSMFNIRTDEHGTRHICVGSIPGRPIEQHEEVTED